MAEGLLKTCIKYGVVAVREPENYEARANLMWASSHAINGLISLGKEPSLVGALDGASALRLL